jgi:serine/threonine protein kinase
MSVFEKLQSLFAFKGQRVNLESRFQKIMRVGQGSMSKLWKARDFKSGRTVALKVLDMAIIKRQTERMRRAYGGKLPPNEGEVAVALKHPNIVVTYEWGTSTANELFLVMEFIEGIGLNFLVDTKDARLTGNRINFLIQAADGLTFMHAQTFINRDLNPRNMMVTPDNVLKLIDFGLTVPNTPEFQKPGNRTGSINYMAPELIKRRPIDEGIDIFSFGVSCYEVLVGRFPWEAGESTERMKQHMNIPPADPRKLNPDVDDDLAKLLLRGIAQDPKKRIQSMKEFSEALRSLKRQDY